MNIFVMFRFWFFGLGVLTLAENKLDVEIPVVEFSLQENVQDGIITDVIEINVNGNTDSLFKKNKIVEELGIQDLNRDPLQSHEMIDVKELINDVTELVEDLEHSFSEKMNSEEGIAVLGIVGDSLKTTDCMDENKIIQQQVVDSISDDNVENENCKVECPSYFDPVCGSDGRTYRSECLLRKNACETKSRITSIHRGSCTNNIMSEKCPEICPSVYSPVCGTDKITYYNKCKLMIASCHNQEIKALHDGICRNVIPVQNEIQNIVQKDDNLISTTPSFEDCVKMCPHSIKYVCGSDFRTYSSSCQLNCATKHQNKNIKMIKEGQCFITRKLINPFILSFSMGSCLLLSIIALVYIFIIRRRQSSPPNYEALADTNEDFKDQKKTSNDDSISLLKNKSIEIVDNTKMEISKITFDV